MRTILHILLFLSIAYCQLLVTQPIDIDAVWTSLYGFTYYEVAVLVLILLVMVSVIVRVKGKVALIAIGVIQALAFGYFVHSLLSRIALIDSVQEASSVVYMRPAPRYVFGILVCYYLIFVYQYIGSVRRRMQNRMRV